VVDELRDDPLTSKTTTTQLQPTPKPQPHHTNQPTPEEACQDAVPSCLELHDPTIVDGTKSRKVVCTRYQPTSNTTSAQNRRKVKKISPASVQHEQRARTTLTGTTRRTRQQEQETRTTEQQKQEK
jgi:hypothetical protein